MKLDILKKLLTVAAKAIVVDVIQNVAINIITKKRIDKKVITETVKNAALRRVHEAVDAHGRYDRALFEADRDNVMAYSKALREYDQSLIAVVEAEAARQAVLK